MTYQSLMSKNHPLNLELDGAAVVGDSVFVICPFHNDSNPSMKFYKETNTLYCFTCGTFSNVINFNAKKNNISLEESANQIAESQNLVYRYAVDKDAENLYQELDKYKKGLKEKHIEYLLSRGIERPSIDIFNLGGHNDFIVQPIFDDNNNIKFFNRRHIKDKIHKLDTKADKSSVLGGLNFIRNLQGPLYITEGYFDVIQAYQEGIPCVNVFGSNLSTEQANTALKYFDDFVLCFDNDDAGVKCTLEALKTIKSISKASKVSFGKFDSKDLGEWLYTNSSVEVIPFYSWAKLKNLSYNQILKTIKYCFTPIETRLNCLKLAEDHGVELSLVYKELEVI